MIQFILSLLAGLGLLTLIVVAVLIVALALRGRGGPLPGTMIIELDLTHGVTERASQSPFVRFARGAPPEIRLVLDALRRAEKDRRVVGLVGRIGGATLRLGEVQELRNGIEAFRRSGKPALAFAETFGELSSANGAYYLATAFDEIYTQPSAEVGLTGLASQTPFVSSALRMLGIVPRLDARAEYKTFRNTFTETEYTDAHREANSAVMESLFAQITDGIAKRRGIDKKALRAVIDRAPLAAREARQEKLIDGLVYWDDVYQMLRRRTQEKAKIVDLTSYHRRAVSSRRSRTLIAYVPLAGTIVTGESRRNPMNGETLSGSETIVRALRAATENARVKAIVIRVSSPGGSYVASDAIRAAVARVREAGKPVVVSMGAVAASGGYFVALDSDRIFAHPGTLTGSIGVVGGKMVVTALANRLGVTFDEVHVGRNALISQPTCDYTDVQWQGLQHYLDRVYEDFVDKVAQGRSMTKEMVDASARGRVWSGNDAKERGLIDEFGGVPEAFAVARELAHIAENVSVGTLVLPKRPPFWARLLKRRADVLAAGFDGELPEFVAAGVERIGRELLAQLGSRPIVRLRGSVQRLCEM